MVGNIRSGQSLSQPLGLISVPRKTTYTIKELIETANKFHKEGRPSLYVLSSKNPRWFKPGPRLKYTIVSPQMFFLTSV